MRHLLSVVLAIILTPLTYVAAGLAAVKLDAAHFGSTIDWTAAGIGIGAGVAAGAFYAVLIMPPRLSPVGPILAGLAFLGVTGWYYLDRSSFNKVFDITLFNVRDVLVRPVTGTLLLSIPLIATVFSPRRWARSGAAIATDGHPFYTTDPQSAAPTYGDPAHAGPTYGEPPTLAGPLYGEQQTSYGYGGTPTFAAPTYGSGFQSESTPVYQPPATEAPVYTPFNATPFQAAPAEPVAPPAGEPERATWPPTEQTWTPRTTDESH
jgi:hypothetical protein